MKIGFIEPGLHVCGGIRRIIEVSNRLCDLRHDVYIFTPKGTPCFWLPIKSKIVRLRHLENTRLDVAVFNLAEQYHLAKAAKAKLKVFWVLAPEALYKNPEIPNRALQQKFFMVANSKFISEYITKRVKVSYKIPVIPGGINPSHFKYDPNYPKEYDVLYYGSPRMWKGTYIIEHALNSLRVKSLKMEGKNTPQHDMWKLYNGSTIFVSASQVEGFGFPELEALTCGCPVVCTDSGGNRDFIKHGINALVVDRSVEGIRKGINKLLGDKVLRRRLKANGLKTAADPRFNWDNVARQFEQVLLSLHNQTNI